MENALSVLVSIFGILMSLGHFPQAMRIVKRKSSQDISLSMYLIFMVGSYIWLAYGIVFGIVPVIISFIVAVIGTTSVFVLTLRYRKHY